MRHNHKTQQKGFTLIEILVVVAIIGLISGVVMTALGTARAKARDAKRKSDLTLLQKALELHFNTNNSYPISSSTPVAADHCFSGPPGRWYGISASGGYKTTTGAGGYIPDLSPNFISVLPTDPLGRTTGYSGYLYCSNGIDYKLLANTVGPESWPVAGEAFYDPARPSIAWMVTNNAGATSFGSCPSLTCW